MPTTALSNHYGRSLDRTSALRWACRSEYLSAMYRENPWQANLTRPKVCHRIVPPRPSLARSSTAQFLFLGVATHHQQLLRVTPRDSSPKRSQSQVEPYTPSVAITSNA